MALGKWNPSEKSLERMHEWNIRIRRLFSIANLIPKVAFLCSLLMAQFSWSFLFSFHLTIDRALWTAHLGSYPQECLGVIIFSFVSFSLGASSEGNGGLSRRGPWFAYLSVTNPFTLALSSHCYLQNVLCDCDPVNKRRNVTAAQRDTLWSWYVLSGDCI